MSVAMAEWTNEHASEGVWERGSGGVGEGSGVRGCAGRGGGGGGGG